MERKVQPTTITVVWRHKRSNPWVTQMGTTLASCSHFVTHGLLLLWRQTTVIMVGCISLSILLAHFVDLFSTHCFRVLPVTASPSGCPFGFPCGQPSRTECLWNTSWSITCDLNFCRTKYFQPYSFHVPRNHSRNLRLPLFPVL